MMVGPYRTSNFAGIIQLIKRGFAKSDRKRLERHLQVLRHPISYAARIYSATQECSEWHIADQTSPDGIFMKRLKLFDPGRFITVFALTIEQVPVFGIFYVTTHVNHQIVSG